MDWDKVYDVDDYVYGKEPNTFLVENVGKITGPVLSLAEGEGRNAVFLASLGLQVHGVDGSEIALAKAQALARSKNVEIQTDLADLSTFEPEAESYGSVISIFAHIPSAVRKTLYPLVEKCLKPGGIILLEAYTEEQLQRDTGGPKNPDMLMTRAKIEREFSNFEPLLLRELEREVHEGIYHTGLASVVQFIGKKM